MVDDALSRRYTLLAKLGSQILGFDNICELYIHDPFFSTIYHDCLTKSKATFISQMDIFSKNVAYVFL